MRTQARFILLAAVAAAAVAAGAYWLRPAAAPTLIFVSNYEDDSVSVVDAALDREIKVIEVPNAPFGLALCTGDTPVVAVARSTASEVALIDAATLEVVASVPTGKGPEFLACSPDGTRLYVTSPYETSITVIDVAARQPARAPIALALKPGPIAVSPDGRRLYVALRDEKGVVQALNAETGAVEGSAPVGKYPSDIALGADGRKVLAASFDDSTITVVDTASFAVLGTHKAATGTGLLVHPSRPLAYSMAGFDDVVAVIDYDSGKEVASIDCGKWPTYSAITADGRFLYVVNEESDNLVKIDTGTNKPVLRIAVGNQPADAVIVVPES